MAELTVDLGSPKSGSFDVCDTSEGAREQDSFLPFICVERIMIMRKATPVKCMIAKGAKDSVQECVSEFISFVTCEANDKCLQEKRKAINGDDLVSAMATLSFDEYVEPLNHYLQLH